MTFLSCYCMHVHQLTHWSRVTLLCVSKLTIIVSDNGLLPGRGEPLSETMVRYCQLDPWEQVTGNFNRNYVIFIQEDTFDSAFCQYGGHIVQGGGVGGGGRIHDFQFNSSAEGSVSKCLLATAECFKRILGMSNLTIFYRLQIIW